MMKDLLEPANIIAFAAFVTATVTSTQVYRLSRKQSNENKIFEEKILSYQEILRGLNKGLNDLFDCIDEWIYESNKSDITDQDKKDLSEGLDEGIDDALFAIEDTITVNCLLLPEPLVKKLEAFQDYLDQEEYLGVYNKKKAYDHLALKTDQLFNDLIEAMRADLEFTGLNTSLKHRIRGNKAMRLLKLED